MLIKKWMCYIGIGICVCWHAVCFAESSASGLGQTIQIQTRLHSFVGHPTWLLIIRDLDSGQNIPYLYDIKRGQNYWLAFTYGRNYLITVSNLKINTYKSNYNDFASYEIKDFCHLESNGRIIRGESMYITIQGDLTRDPESVSCQVTRFAEPGI
jgi:hypothetical protein